MAINLKKLFKIKLKLPTLSLSAGNDRSPPPSYHSSYDSPAHETAAFPAELPANEIIVRPVELPALVPDDWIRSGHGHRDPHSSFLDAIPEDGGDGGDEAVPPYSGRSARGSPSSTRELRSQHTGETTAPPPSQRNPSSTSTNPRRPNESRTKSPHPRTTDAEGPAPTPSEINHVATLLRRVFALRLQVWALQGAHALDRPAQLERARRADEVLEEVRAAVEGWMRQDADGGWMREEREEVVWIAKTLGEGVMKGGL